VSTVAPVTSAAVVLPCDDLLPTLRFFEALGFRLDAIFPADHPHSAELSGHGLRLRLEPGSAAGPTAATVRIVTTTADPQRMVAPNGTAVELVAPPQLALGPTVPELVISRLETGPWGVGRAGMRYRDLIPSRLGGRFIASHIEITEPGPVPDYVHYHHVRFQMIYCWRGWARLVYEDQGRPFRFEAGDCVLQPPEIRHRVLESSGDLAVIEVSSPAEHVTAVEHGFDLPTPVVDRRRTWAGQEFVHHHGTTAPWEPSRLAGFLRRDTAIGTATDGLAGVVVLRADGGRADPGPLLAAPGELLLLVVLDGAATASVDTERHELGTGDSIVVPPGTEWGLEAADTETEVLAVSLPGAEGP
jgi:quercetin dioxygenase-like cupin family protein